MRDGIYIYTATNDPDWRCAFFVYKDRYNNVFPVNEDSPSVTDHERWTWVAELPETKPRIPDGPVLLTENRTRVQEVRFLINGVLTMGRNENGERLPGPAAVASLSDWERAGWSAVPLVEEPGRDDVW